MPTHVCMRTHMHICVCLNAIHTMYVHTHTCIRIQSHSTHMQTTHTPPAPLAHTHLCGRCKYTLIHTCTYVCTQHTTHTQAHTHVFAALHSKSGMAILHSVPIGNRLCPKAPELADIVQVSHSSHRDRKVQYLLSRHDWAIFQALKLLDFSSHGV